MPSLPRACFVGAATPTLLVAAVVMLAPASELVLIEAAATPTRAACPAAPAQNALELPEEPTEKEEASATEVRGAFLLQIELQMQHLKHQSSRLVPPLRQHVAEHQPAATGTSKQPLLAEPTPLLLNVTQQAAGNQSAQALPPDAASGTMVPPLRQAPARRQAGILGQLAPTPIFGLAPPILSLPPAVTQMLVPQLEAAPEEELPSGLTPEKMAAELAALPPPNASKVALLFIEMSSLGGLLGLDRFYLCGMAAAHTDDGPHCYLGFAKFGVCSLACLSNVHLLMPCVLWWVVDATTVLVNAILRLPSIEVFGMSATFEPSTVIQAEKLGCMLCAVYFLELVLIIPAAVRLISDRHAGGGLDAVLTPVDPEPAVRGASQSVVEGATATMLYSAGQGKDAEVCSICCDTFQEEDRMRVLPCLHRYHAACVDKWLALSSTCPLCKGDIIGGAGGDADGERSNAWLDAYEVMLTGP
mmetsp:Transcript_95115/g.307103  ORF Transcript_95115/g.307103 Transcript_95115/m.307103 type:complete len:473 (-) Transcript_95115:71-1489(-)